MTARAAAPLDDPARFFAPLPRSFYDGPVLRVARAMIGKVLVHVMDDGVVAGRIVECEAYRGPEDLAAHSAGGRRTRRTEVMFGPPGRAYMFLLYGMHWAFNVVVGPQGRPHAVLVRAVEPLVGAERMAARRGLPVDSARLTSGPGKLCAALGLDGAAYGVDLAASAPPPAIFLSEGAARAPIARSPRVNVDYAGAWAARPWRFFERGNRFVSVAPRVRGAPRGGVSHR
jgi:DNA-3-methyladenine glycosylase